MSRPVLTHLEPEPVDRATRQRLWAGIARRRARRAPALRLTLAAALLLAVGGVWSMQRETSLHSAADRIVARARPASPAGPAEPPSFAAAPRAAGIENVPPSAAGLVDRTAATTRAQRAPMVSDQAADRNAGYMDRAPLPRPTVAELFAQADRERAAQSWAASLATLERIISEHADHPQAGLAALTQARIYIDSLGEPGNGARALDRAERLGLPATLERDLRSLRRAVSAAR